MRKPLWESYPGALAAYLATGKMFFKIDLYTIELSGGLVVRYSAGDRPVTINGVTWVLGPGFDPAKTEISIGISVDTLNVTLHDRAANDPKATQVNGKAIIPFIQRGGFGGARVSLLAAYIVPPSINPPLPLLADGSFLADGSQLVGFRTGILTGLDTPIATLRRFSGRVGDIDSEAGSAQLQVESDTRIFNTMLPEKLYLPGCNRTLYDADCGLKREDFTISGTASTTGDQSKTEVGHLISGKSTGYFDQGVLIFNTGANAGVRRTVRRHTAPYTTGIGQPLNPGRITVFEPFPYPVAGGESFSVYPGCNKLPDTCDVKFNNVIHFQGFPFIPAESTAL